MPHGFEYIVRPYQSPDSLGNTVIPATPKGTRERAHLTWGGKGTMPSLRYTGVDFNTQKKKKNVTLTEKERESERIRIEQPGKPENYVDVDRAKKVKLGLEEEESQPEQVDLRDFVEGIVDEKLNKYKKDMTSPSGNQIITSTGDEYWAFKPAVN
jgi:hypothetical protein